MGCVCSETAKSYTVKLKKKFLFNKHHRAFSFKLCYIIMAMSVFN